MSAWRALRIGALLLVLAAVALQAWLTRSRLHAWDHTLWVAVYPIAGDDSAATAAHLAALSPAELAPIGDFMALNAASFGLALDRPVRLELSAPLASLPPAPPAAPGALGVIRWSLELRWWAAAQERASADPPGELRLFVVFHDPKRSPRVPHSLALPKAQIGVVHAFADARLAATNAVVIAHELLHTLGATDKYDLATSLPTYPDGYAAPDARPLYPQERAELMGGRIPLSARRAEIPPSLEQVVVGPTTAREIGWVAP
jgi:hypothetical protein